MGSIFGTSFRVSTWGESHGGGVGCVIDGCPPRLPITPEEIQVELDRRRPGQSDIVTPRQEEDKCRILSGVFQGRTLGTPIMVAVDNKDARPSAYTEMETMFRPSHADYTYQAKYGIRNWEGGGRSSARETIGRVAAGVVARKVIRTLLPAYEAVAYVRSIHDIDSKVDRTKVTSALVDATPVRCPDAEAAAWMIERIKQVRSQGDSIGGTIECVVRGVPAGLGEPVFDKLEADLAKAMMSLPATKGFEIGSGFAGALQTGSEHNDAFLVERGESGLGGLGGGGGRISTATNRSGGIQGGISNGEEIFFRVAFKPTATIAKVQQTVTVDGEAAELAARGRHDACVLPRAVPMVEAMVNLVICDHLLRQHGQNVLP